LKEPIELVSAIDRLIEMDEQESTKQHERAKYLSLTAAVFDAVPDALIVTDIGGKIVLFNLKAEFMFGYHRSEMIGQQIEKLLPDSLRKRHTRHRDMYNRFDVSSNARTMGLGLQLVGLRSDGNEFPADITLARMVVPKGVYNLALVRYSPPALVAKVPSTAGEGAGAGKVSSLEEKFPLISEPTADPVALLIVAAEISLTSEQRTTVPNAGK
jgi:PAS domain S-box-containing protein